MTMCILQYKIRSSYRKKRETYWFSDSVRIFLCVDHGKKKELLSDIRYTLFVSELIGNFWQYDATNPGTIGNWEHHSRFIVQLVEINFKGELYYFHKNNKSHVIIIHFI